MQLIYGRKEGEDAICYGYMKTNKRTYGPFGPPSTNPAPNSSCGSNYIVAVPQYQSFESWFQSAYTTVSEGSNTHLGRFAGDQFYNAAILGTSFLSYRAYIFFFRLKNLDRHKRYLHRVF